ncbi:MAG: redoxin domain-containing protein [Paludibacter sp.]
MRKIIILIILAGIITITFLVLNTDNKRDQRKEVYGHIPIFSLPDINGKLVTSTDLPKSKPVLFIFFDPGCHLCKEEIIQIGLHNKQFSNCQVVFFSLLPAKTTQEFLVEIGFVPEENIIFLVDEDLFLYSKMEVRYSPTTYIYNKDGELIKKFEGPVKTTAILRNIANNNK